VRRLWHRRTTGRSCLGGVLAFVLGAFLSLSTAWACDAGFIQEPTATAPVSVTEDLWIGFEYRTYEFPDGRKLVVIRQLRDLVGDNVAPFPLFYIVTDQRHVSVTYIDPEGYGQCSDIQRY
jgi:hypothetical protein